MVYARRDANAKFYGRSIKAKELLSGSVPSPPEAQPLYDALNLKLSGIQDFNKNNRQDNFNYPPTYNDVSGYPPSNNQRAVPPPPSRPSKPIIATALYDFQGEQASDLSFRENDKIVVTYKTDSQNDWWKGTLNGRNGDVIF